MRKSPKSIKDRNLNSRLITTAYLVWYYKLKWKYSGPVNSRNFHDKKLRLINVLKMGNFFFCLVLSQAQWVDFNFEGLSLYFYTTPKYEENHAKDLLEPSCCKKQQKKSQPRNWFGELGTSGGSERYQIGPKWALMPP